MLAAYYKLETCDQVTYREPIQWRKLDPVLFKVHFQWRKHKAVPDILLHMLGKVSLVPHSKQLVPFNFCTDIFSPDPQTAQVHNWLCNFVSYYSHYQIKFPAFLPCSHWRYFQLFFVPKGDLDKGGAEKTQHLMNSYTFFKQPLLDSHFL